MQDFLDSEIGLADDESAKNYLEATLPGLLLGMTATINCVPPDADLNEWSGSITAKVPSKDAKSYSVKKDNLLLRGATLQKTRWIVGVVVYTGRHTKVKMNDKPFAKKTTRIEDLMNRMIIGTLGLQFCLVCAFATFKMAWSVTNRQWTPYLMQTDDISAFDAVKSWCTYMLLLSPMIPISLYVTLEMVKIGHTHFINHDAQMYAKSLGKGAAAQRSIHEELGQGGSE